MKRTRTIASYFSRVAEQEHQTIHPLSPPPPDPEQEQGSIQPPPAPSQGAEQESLRRSPIGDSYGHPNLKWVAGDSKLVSNRVPIRETYFGLSDRHNPNMSIIFPGNPFAERFFFEFCCWRGCRMGIEPFDYSAIQKLNGSYILGVIVEDSLRIRASVVDVDLSQPTVELDQTSLPAAAVELSQPPAEETSNENANFVEEGDSNHVLGPEDIVADPALRKPIEEMHPNIRDDETL